MKSVIYNLILFIMIFKLKIGKIDFVFFNLIVCFTLLLKSGELKIQNKYLYILFGSFLILIYTFISFYFNNKDNYFYLLKYLRVLIILITNYVILNYLYDRMNILEGIFKVLFVNILLMWLQVFFPSLKEIMQKYLFAAGRNNWYRVTGLLNGTSSAGIFLGMSTIYILYLYKQTNKKKYLYIVIASLPLFPMSGFTGFLLLLTGYFILYRKKMMNLYFVSKVMFSMIIFLLVFGSVYNLESPAIEKLGIKQAGRRIVGVFDKSSEVKHGNFKKSLKALKKSYNLPVESSDFIFGNLQPSKSKNATTKSDAGIVTNLHAYGLVGSLILILFLLLHLLLLKNELICALTFSYILIIIKNDLLYGRIIYDFYITVWILILLKGRVKKND